ncbi:hypothetical protein [Pseudoalteromonas sp. T1lg48]|uniref:hypothetical protein n=1 Tax=Pseudoalteromonas sp. T1lg48 TaxID=2077100 RepID=UPI00131A226F|nr:hypothetical protein [Pseudoalteromonas sp. T1lg48]
MQGDEGIGSPKERQLEAGNTGCGGENQSGSVIQNANYMRSTVPYDRLSQGKGDKDDTATAMLRLNHHRDYRELNLLQYRQEAGKFRQRDLYGRVFFICYSRFISAVLSHKFTLNLLQPAFKLLIRQRKGRKLPLD